MLKENPDEGRYSKRYVRDNHNELRLYLIINSFGVKGCCFSDTYICSKIEISYIHGINEDTEVFLYFIRFGAATNPTKQS